ncbi:MAG TPA: hypothetical protein VM819_01490 [Vicinamibacterales bacterium]|jgi:hypothetical protein|nr:hypothetical protein [Vicinamibacterales bacterium]
MSDTSAIRPLVRDRPVPAQAATLDGFALAASGPGVALGTLEPLTELKVQTRNTCYRIVISRDADIVIQGGTFFPDPTRAHVEGASFGGNLLKVGWIGVGLRMEILAEGRRIVTTAVRSIVRDDDAPPARPH